MQISLHEVRRAIHGARPSGGQSVDTPVRSVEDLAALHGVRAEEVARFTEAALVQPEDPARARRIADLAARVERGTYRVEAEAIVEMAERRALADRFG